MLQGKRHTKAMRHRFRTYRRGFSLVEVLVVLAILVILFGLLFAPMMAGMNMVSAGRTQARLQDAARLAAEQMQRELAQAMYVYPLPALTTTSGTITDFSQITFVPPATDPATGAILTPTRPRTDAGTGEVLVTRFYVKPPNTSLSSAYDETNPFILMRQEGFVHLLPSGQYEFGSYDSTSGAWMPDVPLTENALTPREGFDIPASTSVCRDCGAVEVGYVDACQNTSCAGTNIAYLHRDLQFVPERIVGEALAATDNNTIYRARYGSWMGLTNNGTTALGPTALPSGEGELQPRMVVYRWNTAVTAPDQPSYSTIALDSFDTVRSNINLRWNSAKGEVQVGEAHTVHITVNVNSAPAAQAGTFWQLNVEGDAYNASGSGPATVTAPVVPIYPKAPTEWGEPRMPIAFRIEPGRSDGATLVAAKLVPASTRVVIVATSGTDARRADLTRVDNTNQSEIGRYEYCEYLDTDARGGEVRLNRFTPPSPDDFTGLTAFDVFITYYYRRNFDPASNRDDVVYADYSTGEIINLTLIPQPFVDLENYQPSEPNLVVPSDLKASGVPVHLKAVIRNARR